MIGSRLGPYEVTARLGEGGMGEVWRARDPQLGRDVALKVLPEAFTSDPDRTARFEREAKVLASLNHPNIAHIYGLETSGERKALVMELVEGPTLSDRLAQGAIPIDESLAIARQIAEALEEAHAKGIVHRDLKPQNVKVTGDGKVKVLDFGLAKAMDQGTSSAGGTTASPTLLDSPTLTAAGTKLGVILGTAAYMAPEQARGSAVDKRADIWAFGVVLWELLTGRSLFAADTVSDTLAGVLKTEIDLGTLPDRTPLPVRRLLQRCLERDPKKRLHDIADARLEIDAALAGVETAPVAGTPEMRRRWPWLAAIVASALVGAGAAWLLKPEPPKAAWRLNLAPPPEVGGVRLSPRISPDGRAIAYIADDRLWEQELGRFAPRQVPQGQGATLLTWSPDSRSLAFTVGSRLWRTLPSGDAKLVAELPDAPGMAGGLAWTDDDTIVYSTGDSGLLVVAVSGGVPRPLLEPDRPRESDFHEPFALPGGKGVVFIVHRVPEGIDTIELYADGRRRTLLQLPEAWLEGPAWSPDGHLLFARVDGGRGVWALPMQPSRLEPQGEPFLVASGASAPSVSSDGVLLISTLTRIGSHQLSRIDLEGRVIAPVGEAVSHADAATFAPDGSRLAVCIFEAKRASVWIYDLERGSRVRLWSNVSCGSKDGGIAWSPDGERIAIADLSSKNLLVRRSDGADADSTMTEGKQPDWSRDGRWIVFSREAPETKTDLWMLALDGSAAPEPFLATPASEEQPRVSPDGRFLAFVSDESGRREVYLRPFPHGSGRWQVSVEGGELPRWSPTGDRLYFVKDETRLFAVDVVLGATPLLSDPRPQFTATFGRLGLEHGYDVAPDGKSLALVELAGESASGGDLTLITPWPDETTGE